MALFLPVPTALQVNVHFAPIKEAITNAYHIGDGIIYGLSIRP
jgi:hypothetical protein